MYWFGARSLGHVAEKELKAWDADAFEASLAEVKRGRDKLELALEEARAYENGGGAVSDSWAIVLRSAIRAVLCVRFLDLV